MGGCTQATPAAKSHQVGDHTRSGADSGSIVPLCCRSSTPNVATDVLEHSLRGVDSGLNELGRPATDLDRNPQDKKSVQIPQKRTGLPKQV